MTTSCDLIIAELLEIKAEIAALEDKFILKSNKSNFISEIISAVSPKVEKTMLDKIAVLIDKISILESKLSRGLAKFNSINAAMQSEGVSLTNLKILLDKNIEKRMDLLDGDISRILSIVTTFKFRIDRNVANIADLRNKINEVKNDFTTKLNAQESSIVAKAEAKFKPQLAYLFRQIAYLKESDIIIARKILKILSNINNTDRKLEVMSNGEHLLNQPSWLDRLGNKINRTVDNTQEWFGWGQDTKIEWLRQKVIELEAQIRLVKSKPGAKGAKGERGERGPSGSPDPSTKYRLDSLEKKINDVDRKFNLFAATQKAIDKIQNFKIDTLIKALPALVKSIILSLIASGILNGVIGAGTWVLSNGQKIDLGTVWAEILKAKNDARAAATIAVKAEGKADIALNEIKFVTKSALNAMKRLENFTKSEIKFLTNSTRKALLRLQDRIKKNEGVLASLKLTVAGIQKQVSQLKPFFTAKLQELKTNLLNQVGKLNLDIKKIFWQIATLSAQIAGLILTVAGINAILGRLKPLLGRLIPGMVQQNTYVTNNYDQRRTTIVNNPGQQNIDLTEITRRVRRIDVTTQANLFLSTSMDLKLGSQLKDGLSGWMTRFTNWSVFSRLMEFMTLAATIHNAMMLSNNLTTTLISSIQNVVNFWELKDSEGKGYDVQALIKTSIESFLKTVFGAENYAVMNTAWKNANRIYQSTGNLLNSMLSFGDITTQALQLVTGQTSKIGNALRAWGKVGEAAYGWMNPNPNFSNPILMKLNSLNETASIVEEVSQQPQSVKDAKKEVEDNAAQLAKDIGQAAGGKDGKIFPEAAKVKAEQAAKKANSAAPEISREDTEADE